MLMVSGTKQLCTHAHILTLHSSSCVPNGVFSKWSRTVTEFSEFRESEKSLKHE